jgi:hypothetical protein
MLESESSTPEEINEIKELQEEICNLSSVCLTVAISITRFKASLSSEDCRKITNMLNETSKNLLSIAALVVQQTIKESPDQNPSDPTATA